MTEAGRVSLLSSPTLDNSSFYFLLWIFVVVSIFWKESSIFYITLLRFLEIDWSRVFVVSTVALKSTTKKQLTSDHWKLMSVLPILRKGSHVPPKFAILISECWQLLFVRLNTTCYNYILYHSNEIMCSFFNNPWQIPLTISIFIVERPWNVLFLQAPINV